MTNTLGMSTNKTIIQLLNDYRSGLLVLKPRFQRNLVWNNEHKAAFIETILKNLPFPEVYFSDGEIDLQKQKTTIWVVDGQQRLDTIFEYIDGKLDLAKYSIPKFSDLNETKQTDFFTYVVVVRSLGKLTDNEINEIFQRINSVNYALNAVEISNALYDGEFISLAKKFAENEHFKKLEISTDQEIKRMEDVKYVLLILASVELGIYFTETKEMDDLIKRYNDEYPSKQSITKAMEKTFQLIDKLDLEYDSIWYKKTSMFSLITELGKFYKNNSHKTIDTKVLKEKLLHLEQEIIKSKTENPTQNKYAKFYKYMFQQTTSKTGRTTRGNLIEEVLNTL